MGRFDLSDDEWTIVEWHFSKAGRGPVRQDNHRILNGIFYILRKGHHGAICRNAPEYYGPQKTVCNRYSQGDKAASGKVSLMRWPTSVRIV